MTTRYLSPFLAIAIFTFSVPLLSQNDDSNLKKQYSPAELKADLNTLKENMEAIHPAIYLYYPKDSLDAAFARVESALNEPKTEIEFYRLLRPTLQYIANGHTDYKASEGYMKQLAETLPRFPFDVYWDKDTLFVLRNMSTTESIKPGDAIMNINGKKARYYIEYFASQITRDGLNTSLPIHSASQSFKTYYALFWGTPKEYEIEFQNTNGKRFTKKINAELLPSIRETRKERYPNLNKSMWQTKKPAYTLNIKGKTAFMTLKTFSKNWVRKTTGKSHKKFFKKSFQKIKEKNIEHLIIDMRGNGGGDPEPTIALFSHLYDKRFDFYDDMKLLVNKIPNHKLYDEKIGLLNLIAWTKVKKKKEGGYVAKSLKKYRNNKPAKNIFTGEVYVLTDPVSFSATGEMTGIIKNYLPATFIGEEPGGNPISNTSGIMLPLVLPNTKMRVTLPLVQFVMAVEMENTGYGIMPDYEVKNTIWDEINGRDAVMEFTLELIGSQSAGDQ